MEKVLFAVAASLLGIIISLLVYIWTRSVSEQDKINAKNTVDHGEYSDEIGKLKERMTAIETKHEDEMCKVGRGKQIIKVKPKET